MPQLRQVFAGAALALAAVSAAACGGKSGMTGMGGMGGAAGRVGLGPVVDVVRPVDTAEVADPALVLWYDRPATLWMNQALPIGNGEIGGMVFGGTAIDHIQFNEK